MLDKEKKRVAGVFDMHPKFKLRTTLAQGRAQVLRKETHSMRRSGALKKKPREDSGKISEHPPREWGENSTLKKKKWGGKGPLLSGTVPVLGEKRNTETLSGGNSKKEQEKTANAKTQGSFRPPGGGKRRPLRHRS